MVGSMATVTNLAEIRKDRPHVLADMLASRDRSVPRFGSSRAPLSCRNLPPPSCLQGRVPCQLRGSTTVASLPPQRRDVRELWTLLPRHGPIRSPVHPLRRPPLGPENCPLSPRPWHLCRAVHSPLRMAEANMFQIPTC